MSRICWSLSFSNRNGVVHDKYVPAQNCQSAVFITLMCYGVFVKTNAENVLINGKMEIDLFNMTVCMLTPHCPVVHRQEQNGSSLSQPTLRILLRVTPCFHKWNWRPNVRVLRMFWKHSKTHSRNLIVLHKKSFRHAFSDSRIVSFKDG